MHLIADEQSCSGEVPSQWLLPGISLCHTCPMLTVQPTLCFQKFLIADTMPCRLRDCPGDEARISHLASNMTVKLVGRAQVGQQVREMLLAILHHRDQPTAAAVANHPVKIKAEPADSSVPAVATFKQSSQPNNGCMPSSASHFHPCSSDGILGVDKSAVLPHNSCNNSAVSLHRGSQLPHALLPSNRTQNGY